MNEVCKTLLFKKKMEWQNHLSLYISLLKESSSLPHIFWEARIDNNIGLVVVLNRLHKLRIAALHSRTSGKSTTWWRHVVSPALCIGPAHSLITALVNCIRCTICEIRVLYWFYFRCCFCFWHPLMETPSLYMTATGELIHVSKRFVMVKPSLEKTDWYVWSTYLPRRISTRLMVNNTFHGHGKFSNRIKLEKILIFPCKI